MTIDEVINELTSLKDCGILPISYEKYGKPFVTKKSIEVAIETMRKYQKIEEIITDWKSDGGAFEMSESYWLRLISEVVEDGNDD